MLERIRRNRKASNRSTGGGVTAFATILRANNNGSTSKPTNFLDLPGEIRNHIYEIVAQATALTLMPFPKQRKSSQRTAAEMPGLLLASHRLRTEARPILLSLARLEIKIVNFDFRNLMRVVSGLYSTELKALRANNRLVIRMSFRRSGVIKQQVNEDLRRWLVHRADGLDRLPWHYAADFGAAAKTNDSGVHDASARMQQILSLYESSEETLQWELLRLMNVLEPNLADNSHAGSES